MANTHCFADVMAEWSVLEVSQHFGLRGTVRLLPDQFLLATCPQLGVGCLVLNDSMCLVCTAVEPEADRSENTYACESPVVTVTTLSRRRNASYLVAIVHCATNLSIQTPSYGGEILTLRWYWARLPNSAVLSSSQPASQIAYLPCLFPARLPLRSS